MNAHDLIASPLVYRLGWTLLHSLWQGAAVAGLLALLLWLLSRASANTRYLTASAALLLTLALSVATFQLVSAPKPRLAPLTVTDPTSSLPQSAIASASPGDGERSSAVRSPTVGIPVMRGAAADRAAAGVAPVFRSQVAALAVRLEPAFPWLVGTWVLGVLGLSIWHLGGCIAVQRLKSLGTHPADSQAYALLTHLTRRMNLRRPVRLLQSALVETPVVFGCWRPVILIPASVLLGLAPAQLEAILAHELAHVRRHDYLVNLLQTVVETLLFYHPAIWWISRQVRREREHCCDDIAVQVCGNRLTYTTALAAIEEVRGAAPAAALAAGGNNHGELLGRIQRLLGLPGRRPAGALLAACLVIGLLLVSLFSGALSAPATRTAQDQRIDELIYVLRKSVTASRVDQWAGAIKELAEIGKPAVPALVRELDRADGFFEKSAIAYTLRAINDPRAVPSLIRALPRSAERIGGWGLTAIDLNLHRFMTQHTALPTEPAQEYFGFNGPQVELERTLARITGHSEGDVYPKSNSPADQEAAGKLRRELPGKWRSWWEANHQKFVTDAELATVESQSPEKQDAVEAVGLAKFGPLFPAGPDVHLSPVHDLVLPAETSIDVKAHLDFDTGRSFSQFEGSRHNSDRDYPRWVQQAGIDAHVQGNSLIGSDVHAWLVDNALWKTLPDELTRQSTIDPGLKGPSSDFYPRRSEGEARLEPDALPATLLFTTREGGRGILQILQALSEEKQPKGLHIRYRMFQSPRLPIVKAATLSTQPVPAALSFGPERQVTLHDPRGDKDAALNFDTGKTLALPAGAYEAGYEKWLNASDASVMVLTDSSREILAAIRGTKVSIQKVASDAWDHLTPAEVVDLAGRFPPSSDNLQALSIFPSLPNTAVFQTPHGTVGLVQIIEANGVTGNTSPMALSEGNYPKTLKLRYKLLLDAKPAATRPTIPTAAGFVADPVAAIRKVLPEGMIVQRVTRDAYPLFWKEGKGLAISIGLSPEQLANTPHKDEETLIVWVMPADYQQSRPTPHPTSDNPRDMPQAIPARKVATTPEGDIFLWGGRTELGPKLVQALLVQPPATQPAATIEAKQTDFSPEPDTYYTLFPNDIYVTDKESFMPAETRPSRAWSRANEFVYRTSLRNSYRLPGSWVSPEGNGYLIRFNPIAGGDAQAVFVTGDFKLVKRMGGQPATRPAATTQAATRVAEGPDDTLTVTEMMLKFRTATPFWKQADIARQLISRKDKSVLPAMVDLLASPDRCQRCNAGWVLAGLGDDRGLAAVLSELTDTSDRPARDGKITSDGRPNVTGQIMSDRYYAAHVLGEIGDRRAVPALIEVLRDKSIGYKAAIVLGRIGDAQAIPPLKERLNAAKPDDKLWPAYGLAKLNDPAGVPAMAEFLKHPGWEQRRGAVEALGEIHDARAAAALAQSLKDANPDVRASAALALGGVGNESSIPALEALLHDDAMPTTGFLSRSPVRQAAADAIQRLRNAKKAATQPTTAAARVGQPAIEPAMPLAAAALPLWFDIMPFRPVRTLAAGLCFIYEGRRPAAGSRDAVSASLEIRDAGNQKRIAEVPDAVGIPKDSGYSGGLFLTPDQIRRIGPLPDGEYLVALTFGNHVRCSNVASLKIDARYQPDQEPTLRLVPVPLSPGERLPSVWLVTTGPKVSDAKFNDMAIAFPILIINGVEHSQKNQFWHGGVRPIQPGQQDMRLIRLVNFTPDIPFKAHYNVKARVLDYVSAEVTIPPDDDLGTAWDQATGKLAGRPAAAPLLRGSVLGPDGRPAVGYEVRLSKPDGQSSTESCNQQGEYQFTNVPAGEYSLSVNPAGMGTPGLTIEKVTLRAGNSITQNLDFVRRFLLAGRLTYSDGVPAANRDVSLTAESDDGRVEYVNFCSTDADGRWMFAIPFRKVSYVGLSGTAADGPLPEPKHDLKAAAGEFEPSVDLVIPQKSPARARPASTQPTAAITPEVIVDRLADAIAAIAAKYPELANYQKDKAKLSQGPPTYDTSMFGLSFARDFTAPAGKRAIEASDFGAQGLYVEFLCGDMPAPGTLPYAMAPPALELRNLRLYIWTDIKTGANPSPGLVEELTRLLRSHAQKLKELDQAAGQQPAQPGTSAPATQTAQVSTLGDVVVSLKAELVKISKGYPELTGIADTQLQQDAQTGIWSLSFFHNCRDWGKRGYEDIGPNPAAVTFRITTAARHRWELANTEMQMPPRDVRNRQFIVYDRLYIGKAPTTPGFESAVRALLEKHVAMLDELERTMPASASAPASPMDPNKEWVPGQKVFVDQLHAETYAQSVTMMADWDSNYLNSGNSGPTPMLPESIGAIVNGRRFAKLMDDTAGARWSSQRAWTLQFLDADIARWIRLYQQGQRPNQGTGLFSKPGTNPDELIVPLMFRMNAVLLLIAQHPESASLPPVVKYVQGLGEHANFAVAALAADKIMSVTDLSAWNAAQRKVLEQYQTWKKMPEANAFTTYATVEFPSYRELSRPQLRAGSTGVPLKSETPAENISVVTPQMYTVHIVLDPSGSRTYSDGNSGKTALAKAIVDFAQRVVLAENP